MTQSSAPPMQQDQAMAPPPPPPPPHQRRPRVREVSSRFMSPVASSSSFSPLPATKHRSSSVQRQRRHLDLDHLPLSDDNKSSAASSTRSPQRKTQPQQQPPRSVMRLSKENDIHNQFRSLRPDTPIVTATSSSCLRRSGSTSSRNISNMSAAARLLQSTTSTTNTTTGSDSIMLPICSESHNNSSLRASMPETDMLNSVSSRLLAEKNMNTNTGVRSLSDSAKLVSASPCSRSLDLARSISDPNSLKQAKKPPRSIEVSAKVACGDARKGRKGGSQEDAHSLRLLHNHYLQWRFANAKAEACALAQRRETERMLHSLGVRVSELYDSVKRKRIELSLLRRTKAVSTVLESQMPYLDQWYDLEGDYLTSLSEATQALFNSSVQLPIGGNVRVDVKEVGEALNSAVKLMELIACNVQRFMPKAEETEILISELARITGGERSLIEECGDMLFMTHKSQVEECSLRSQLIQFHGSSLQKQELLAG